MGDMAASLKQSIQFCRATADATGASEHLVPLRASSHRARARLRFASKVMPIRRGGCDVANGKCKFKKIDVTRALRAAIAAGLEVARMEIDADGKIVVVTGKALSTNEPATDFDKWKINHARQT
jgi:hypothetical protein